jgi:tetratricopeptide (TPR) repeat protein
MSSYEFFDFSPLFQGEYQKAMQIYSQEYKSNLQNYDLLYQMAITMLAAASKPEHYEKAGRWLDKVIQEKPKFLQAHTARALVHIRTRQYAPAADILDNLSIAISTDPSVIAATVCLRKMMRKDQNAISMLNSFLANEYSPVVSRVFEHIYPDSYVKNKKSIEGNKDKFEKISQIRKNFGKLQDFLNMTSKAKLTDVASILSTDRDTLLSYLIENQSKLKGVKIDGDYLVVENTADFMSSMDSNFNEWGDKELSKEGKIEGFDTNDFQW